MRVALVATSYPRSADDASGHFVRAEARLFASRGDEVHVIAPRPMGEPGITAHQAGGERLFSWPGAAARAAEAPSRLLSAPGFAARAARLLARLSPDRVVAHWMVPSALPVAMVGSIRNHCPMEVVCHGADVRLLLALPRPAREAALRSVCARASRVRLVARSLLDALAGSVGQGARSALEAVAVVEPPLVDVSPALVRSPPEPGAYLLCSGRLVADKRVELAIRAVASAPSSPRLFIAGDGPDRQRLEALSSEIAPGRVCFLGQLPRPDALGWLKGASALVHASAVEASPTVVLEALALGVPVVACGAGDIARWAELRSGIDLCAAEPEAMALALARMLDRAAAQGGQTEGGAATSVT